jgi:hypothetical protein
MGKSPSTFYDSANSNSWHQARYKTHSDKKSKVIAEEYC